MMERPALPNTDLGTAWLGILIQAMETAGSSAAAVDPSVSKAFQHRLALPGLLQPRATRH